MGRRIAIVGARIEEYELRDRAKDYELWSVNNLFEKFPETKFSAWFELHSITNPEPDIYLRRNIPWYPISRRDRTVRAYMDDINRLGCTVWMQRQWPQIEQSYVFPFDFLMKRFGRYFGCSFAWMTAFAITEKVDEIAYFGVVLGDHEYYYQRPSTERLIGYAEGLGIKITIDESSDLLKSNYVYAFAEDFELIHLLHGTFAADMTMTMLTGMQQGLERWFFDRAEYQPQEQGESNGTD